jgi:hypothetical protein
MLAIFNHQLIDSYKKGTFKVEGKCTQERDPKAKLSYQRELSVDCQEVRQSREIQADGKAASSDICK